ALVPGDAAQRDAVVERAVVADFRRLADHDTHAVVDEDAAPDARAGMDLDAGEEAGHVRKEPREPSQLRLPQRVRDAMQLERVEARIARENFPDRARGRIAFEHATDVFADSSEHGRSLVFPTKIINFSPVNRFARNYIDFIRQPDVARLLAVALLARMPVGMVGFAMLMFLREALGN